MQLQYREVELKHAKNTAKYDQVDMRLWSDCRIDAEELARRLTKRNDIWPELTPGEAIQLAHRCGYWELDVVPEWIRRDCEKYELKRSPIWKTVW